MLPGSDQHRWLAAQIASLPQEVAFVILTLHHPPVADLQRGFTASHNPRANEIALANLLKDAAATHAARFVVVAGHIHNYERFSQDDVLYLVSGGGGATPYPVERSPQDAYQDRSFPNFHYVKLVLTDDALIGT